MELVLRQIKEYEQKDTDIRFSSDELSMVQKRDKTLENEYKCYYRIYARSPCYC